MRCRETAGILFKHRCQEPPSGQCTMCQKPVCSGHARWQGHNIVCVSCLRQELNNPYRKHSYAYLRDDPFFFWYFREGSSIQDPYGADDYALFDDGDADFGGDMPGDWSGS